VCIGKHFCGNFLILNGLKQGDALSPLLLNFALGHAIRKVHEHEVGLKLYGTHKLLTYADDVTLLGDNINTIKKTTETLSDTSKEVGLESILTLLHMGSTHVKVKVTLRLTVSQSVCLDVLTD
jgi:hypothetical protein